MLCPDNQDRPRRSDWRSASGSNSPAHLVVFCYQTWQSPPPTFPDHSLGGDRHGRALPRPGVRLVLPLPDEVWVERLVAEDAERRRFIVGGEVGEFPSGEVRPAVSHMFVGSDRNQSGLRVELLLSDERTVQLQAGRSGVRRAGRGFHPRNRSGPLLSGDLADQPDLQQPVDGVLGRLLGHPGGRDCPPQSFVGAGEQLIHQPQRCRAAHRGRGAVVVALAEVDEPPGADAPNRPVRPAPAPPRSAVEW